MRRQLFQQEHLVNVVACQPIRRGDHDQIDGSVRGAVTQAIKTGPAQGGAAVSVIAEDLIERHIPTLLPGVVA